MSRVKHILVLFLFYVVLVCSQTNQPKRKSGHGTYMHTLVSVVYSSTSKPCIHFINEQLLPTFKNLSQYMNLELYPNGKPQETVNQINLDIGNMIQRCVLKEKVDSSQHLKFIDCFLATGRPETYQICAYKTGFDGLKLMECIKHIEKEPEIDVGILPHIMFNGQENKELENEAKTDLFAVVCELSNYPPPCHGIERMRKKKEIKKQDQIDKCELETHFKRTKKGRNSHASTKTTTTKADIPQRIVITKVEKGKKPLVLGEFEDMRPTIDHPKIIITKVMKDKPKVDEEIEKIVESVNPQEEEGETTNPHEEEEVEGDNEPIIDLLEQKEDGAKENSVLPGNLPKAVEGTEKKEEEEEDDGEEDDDDDDKDTNKGDIIRLQHKY